MEVPFFISAAVLGALQPAIAGKPEDCLSAFDAHRAQICTVAANAYARRRSGSYDLLASDF